MSIVPVTKKKTAYNLKTHMRPYHSYIQVHAIVCKNSKHLTKIPLRHDLGDLDCQK